MAEEAAAAAPVEFGGKTYKPLADGKYDAIIMGTGLKECILSGLLSTKGKRVLHLDRNGYYGGDCASLNLTNLYRKFVKDEEPPKAFFDLLGANRDYNVDLIPKFIMAGGNLVKLLVATDVTRYLNFKLVDGCYVYKKGAGIFKVPATLDEARSTSLLSLMQKNWLRSLLQAIDAYRIEDPKTWKGSMDWSKATCAELFKYMWFDKDTGDFVGHAMALEETDDYLAKPALPAMMAVKLYGESLARYGKSPFIYPEYGLGGLPEGFSRLCAIHGGTFMLNKGVDEVLYNADGTAAGVRSGSGDDAEVALAPLVIGDPSYFPPAKLRRTGRIIRTICILNHPVAGLENPDSGMIILPASQVGRKSDIYVTIVGKHHEASAKGRYVAIVSTTVETAAPEKEVEPGIALLGEMVTRFNNIVDTYAPADDGMKSRSFVTGSYDATSHFEATTDEVLDLYRRIFGEEFDLSKPVELPTE